jgi:uncharacterized Fe-S cluster protein YjdI
MKLQIQLPQHVQEKFDLEIKAEVIRQKTEDELRSNPEMLDYFSHFNEQSVEGFVRNYARKKSVYLTKGPEFMNSTEQEELKYKVLAEEGLWAIQQKKLFNLQCQWRAGQIKLKGVEHSGQFHLLSANIQHCPYITPVSRSEMDLYISYLNSGNVGELFLFDTWQDYDSFKTDHLQHLDSTGEDFDMLATRIPTWYSFYDFHLGTDVLMELRDYKGEKENIYKNIARKRQAEELRKGNLTINLDKRPYINPFDTAVIEDFIKQFEDKKLLKYCRAVESFNYLFDDYMEVEEAIATLRNAGEEIPLEACADWKVALIHAARQFELNQIARLMPLVFQEYHFRLENCINYEQTEIDKKRAESAFQYCELSKKQILYGRLLSGESEDFNF